LHPAELEEDDIDDEVREQAVDQAVISEEVVGDAKPTSAQ